MLVAMVFSLPALDAGMVAIRILSFSFERRCPWEKRRCC